MATKKVSKKVNIILINALGLLLTITNNPQHLPLLVLIVPFVIVFLDLYLIGLAIVRRLEGQRAQNQVKQQRVKALIIAAVPTLCLLLESIGQFSIHDFIILVILVSLLWFYAGRGSWSEEE